VPTVLAASYLTTIVVRVALVMLNVRHRRRHGYTVPQELADHIDPSTLRGSAKYASDRETFALIQTILSALIVLWFLFGGGLTAYDRFIAELVGSRLGQGVTFFVGLLIASSLLDLPFDVFSTFRIEQRHGFNRSTPGLFFGDWLKSTLLGTVLVAGIAAGGLSLFYATPRWYWLWIWLFGLALGLGLILIAPYVIEPLFIKTSPLADEGLSKSVRELANRAGVKVTQVFEVDASRRSSHSNAYFTGIGRVKRVVLFDTLLARLSEAEVLAVLGHELGHWKLRHITQRLVVSAAFGLASLYAAAQLLAWEQFPTWFGLDSPSVPAEVVTLAFIASILGFALTPFSAYWSRRHEWQADHFAAELTGRPQDLAAALVKLAQDNLTNLHPHPLYAAFHYAHPATVLRVRKLLGKAG
jgi:STE24 endopeptidase